MATLIMILLLNWFFVFWGYKHDEKVRADQRAGIIPYEETFPFRRTRRSCSSHQVMYVVCGPVLCCRTLCLL